VIPDVVVDIGNTRMKWGRVADARIGDATSLPLDDPNSWDNQRRAWGLKRSSQWVLASVNPAVQGRFSQWVEKHGGRLIELTDYRQVPLRLQSDSLRQTGIDRLLAALAARHQVQNRPVIILNVGTAITADVVDESGTFLGGAILPGPQLMARSLHEHTAKLPLIDSSNLHTVWLPGKDTESAIEGGILAATGGAFQWLIANYTASLESPPVVYLTGGGAKPYLDTDGAGWTPDPEDTRYSPTLTLDGIRLAAEALP
jgi:type III pantothenate kinase